MLSTFEFWVELNTRCKGWALSKFFLFSVQYKTDTKQNKVLSSLAEWVQKFKFLYTTRS